MSIRCKSDSTIGCMFFRYTVWENSRKLSSPCLLSTFHSWCYNKRLKCSPLNLNKFLPSLVIVKRYFVCPSVLLYLLHSLSHCFKPPYITGCQRQLQDWRRDAVLQTQLSRLCGRAPGGESWGVAERRRGCGVLEQAGNGQRGPRGVQGWPED